MQAVDLGISQAQIDSMLAQRYRASHLLDELATPGIWWDKICLDGTLLGFASSLLTSGAGEMKLDKLYIDPTRQRLGLGARLIEHVSQRALEQGCATLILAVNKQNAAAIAAYRKYGFAVRESVCVDIGDGFVMDVVTRFCSSKKPVGPMSIFATASSTPTVARLSSVATAHAVSYALCTTKG